MYNVHVCMTYSWRLVRRNRIWLSLLRPAASMTMTSSGSAAAADRRTGNFHAAHVELSCTTAHETNIMVGSAISGQLFELVSFLQQRIHTTCCHTTTKLLELATQGAPESLWFCSIRDSSATSSLQMSSTCTPSAMQQGWASNMDNRA